MHDHQPQTELPALHESWLPKDHPLHRPRHGGQQLVALVAAVVFFASPLVSWTVGARATEFENRKLAEFPSISQGWGFFTGLGHWAADNLVFRQAAVQAESGVSRGVFGEELPHDQGQSGGPLQQSGTTSPDGRPNNGNPPTQSGYPLAFDGKDGWLYLGYDVAQKCKPAQPFTDTVAQLKRLRQAVEDSGRKFVLLVPPDKTTEVPEHLPDHYVGKDCHDAATAELWQELQGTGVLDIRKDMRTYTTVSGRPIYHELDSHWTDEGAMVAVKDLAESVQPGVSAHWTEFPDQTFSTQGDLPPLLGRTGSTHGNGYQLRPDGMTDKTQAVNPIFTSPIHVTSAPVPGMITSKVGVLGDSYSIPAGRYYAAAFSDLTMVTYSTADKDPGLVANFVADRKVVVLEMVERNVSGGFSNILRPGCVDQIVRVLSTHPMR